MRGARTGLGIAFGAALGLLLGQMVFESWWWGPMIGAAAGLVIGAVADMWDTADDERDRDDEDQNRPGPQ